MQRQTDSIQQGGPRKELSFEYRQRSWMFHEISYPGYFELQFLSFILSILNHFLSILVDTIMTISSENR